MQAVELVLTHLYSRPSAAERKQQRDQEIRHLFGEGMTKAAIARKFGISERRVGQIIDEDNGWSAHQLVLLLQIPTAL